MGISQSKMEPEKSVYFHRSLLVIHTHSCILHTFAGKGSKKNKYSNLSRLVSMQLRMCRIMFIIVCIRLCTQLCTYTHIVNMYAEIALHVKLHVADILQKDTYLLVNKYDHICHLIILIILTKCYKKLKFKMEVGITIKRKETSGKLEMAIIHQPALAIYT